MDIYSILASKPHIPHYLKRYYNFILACKEANEKRGLTKRTKKNPNGVYMESHHIAPKALDLFPEYISFSKHPWNKISLTGRQHLIAHIILSFAYPSSNIVYAFNRMINSSSKRDSNIKINSRIYATLREILADKNSKALKERHTTRGHPKGMLGKFHSIETKLAHSKLVTGSNNANYGKRERPNVTKSNKNSVYASKRGKSQSLEYIKRKLLVFNSLTTKELFRKIEIELQDNNNNSKIGRYAGKPSFTIIAKKLSSNKSSKGTYLKRFYDGYKDNTISCLDNSSTLI